MAIYNKAGQTWSYKTWQEQEYPEEVEPVEYIKVKPREQFVKKMLEEHDDQRRSYSTASYYGNVTLHDQSDVRSGYRGTVRSQYRIQQKEES